MAEGNQRHRTTRTPEAECRRSGELMPRAATQLALFVLLAVLGTAGLGAAELTGRVVGVTDGDTLTLLTPQRTRLTIRLIEIDAPEGGQPWGERSKQALSGLVFSHDVRVVESGKDQYGRTLGRV